MAIALTLFLATSGSGSTVPSGAGATVPLVWGPVLAGLWGGGAAQPDGQPPPASVVTPNEISPPATTSAGPRASASAVAPSTSPGPEITETRPERPAVGAPPVEAPISMRELHARVSPAVVALVVSGGAAAPSVVTGVLVTASGLVLTSRRALAEAIDGNAAVAMVRSAARGRATLRELAAAVPARLVAVSDDLDLALVESMPAEAIFYPHLPVARRRAPDGSSAVAVGHAQKRGLWSATLLPLGPATSRMGVERWLRPLPGETSLVGAGTPLVDGVGRIVALAVEPTSTRMAASSRGSGEARLAVDAEGLWRFLLAANAPELRFAGVPPFRRPAPGAATIRAADVLGASHPGPGKAPATGPAGTAGAISVPDRSSDAAGTTATLEMPGVVRKGNFDRHFSRIGDGTPGAQSPGPAIATVTAPVSSRGAHGHFGESNAVSITTANLERQATPVSLRVDTNDAPERGARDAPVTIVEIGDYHAPETREVESTLQELIEGPAAQARLLWKDADRGDGADYDLPARAARAAAEQNEFWPMHDRLLSLPISPALDPNRARRLARELSLDAKEFAASLSSDGLASSVETDAVRAGRLPLLCTPAFVVNGQAVDGGSIAAAALRAAVDDELARFAGPGGVTRRPAREIAAGAPIVGAAYDAEKMARAIAELTSRRSKQTSPGAPATTASTAP